MKRTYQSGAQKRPPGGRKIAEAARNSQRVSSWLIRLETSEHIGDFVTGEQVTSVSCVSDNKNYTTQNLRHNRETISVNFVQESCSNAREALVSFDNEGNKQDVSIRETESAPLLVGVNGQNYNTSEENSDTNINGRSAASKNDDFSAVATNSEIKKAITAADPKQPKRPFF